MPNLRSGPVRSTCTAKATMPITKLNVPKNAVRLSAEPRTALGHDAQLELRPLGRDGDEHHERREQRR
jgi:hypothetical protein